jgi:hypothetical protein
MTPEQFKNALRECRTETDARRVMNANWPAVIGTYTDLRGCFLFAADILEALAENGVATGARGACASNLEAA